MTMARLIDVNDVYSLFNENGAARLHVADIDTIPRVDAVPVVRCMDCKHYNEGFCVGYHAHHDIIPDDFCSYGERKGGDGNG